MISLNFDRKVSLCLVVLFSLALSTPITHALGYDSFSFFFRLFIIITALAVFLFFGAYPLLLLALPALAAALGLFVYVLNPFAINQFMETLSAYTATTPSVPFIVMVSIVTLVFLILLTAFKGNLLLLFLIGVFVFVPLWYLYVDSAYTGAVVYALGWFFLLSYQSGRKIWSRQSPENMMDLRSGWIRYTAWILFFMLLFAMLLPKNIPPVPWTSFQVWVDEVLPFIAELRGGEPRIVRGTGGEFGVSVAGFGQGGQLGGPLITDPTVLVEVAGSGGHYLRGSVGKDYTGTNWALSGERQPWEAIKAAGPIEDYLKPVTLRINHKRLITSTVFSLPYMSDIRQLKRPPLQTEGNGLFSETEIELDRPYTVYGQTFGYRGDFSLLESGEHGPELESWLLLPDEIPVRVIELAQTITQDTHGYYNKMKALESYLRTTYRYSENPSSLPPKRDFVDFFLFDEQAGYCTSFASALAVMGRAVGVPTRYVQGFRMPEEADSDGLYKLPGTLAHAWVEAYIPGLGWLTFEATPVYTTMDALPDKEEIPEPPDKEPGPDPETPSETPNYLPLALRILSLLLAILIAAVLLLFVTVLIRRRLRMVDNFGRIKEQTTRMQAAIYYNMVLGFLAGIELGKLPGETPLEYSLRINRLVSDWKLDFNKITEKINPALYSEDEETPDWLIDQLKAFHEVIFKRYIVHKGKPAAFIEIYLQKKYLSHEFFKQFMK